MACCMDPDELSVDLDTDGCWHPPDRREYSTGMDATGDHVVWAVDCGECGTRLAEGADRV